MLGNVKKMMEMRARAKKAKKMLAELEVEATEGAATLVVNGEGHLVAVELSDEFSGVPKARLEKDIQAAAARAQKKAAEVAAEKMRPFLGDMGME